MPSNVLVLDASVAEYDGITVGFYDPDLLMPVLSEGAGSVCDTDSLRAPQQFCRR